MNLSQLGTDATVMNFPGLDEAGLGAYLSGAEASASDNSSDQIFGTVEFDSSWMNNTMDWVRNNTLICHYDVVV